MLTQRDDVDLSILQELGGKESNNWAKAKFGQELIDGSLRVTVFHYKDKINKLRFDPYAIPDRNERKGLETVTFPQLTPREMEFVKNGTREQVNKFLNTI